MPPGYDNAILDNSTMYLVTIKDIGVIDIAVVALHDLGLAFHL